MAGSGGDARRVRLEIHGVSVVFRTPRGVHTALEDVSLDLREGERLILLGPSGCGKSTLLKVIACFETPAAGSVRLDGASCTKPGPDRMVIFQEFDQLFPWKTVRENVAYALRVTGRAAGREADERAVGFLRMVGLERFLFVTHSIEEAIVLGDRIVVMTPGPGRVKAVLDNPETGLEALERPGAAALHREIRALLEFDPARGSSPTAAWRSGSDGRRATEDAAVRSRRPGPPGGRPGDARRAGHRHPRRIAPSARSATATSRSSWGRRRARGWSASRARS